MYHRLRSWDKMNGAPCLIKQQCPEAHVELMGKSYIHPLDVEERLLSSLQLHIQKVLCSLQKGVFNFGSNFLGKRCPQRGRRRRGSQYRSHPCFSSHTKNPLLPSSELIGIFGGEKWARSHTYGSSFDSDWTDWIRTKHIFVHCLH